MLRRLGWTPLSDIFDKIGDEDVVQIYSHKQCAIFQNLNFFKWITFTLEDLYTGAWFELSRRNDEVTMGLYQLAVEYFTGVRSETLYPGLPEHLCEEIGSEGLAKFWVHVKYLSPLRKDGATVGLMATNSCREYLE